MSSIFYHIYERGMDMIENNCKKRYELRGLVEYRVEKKNLLSSGGIEFHIKCRILCLMSIL